MPYLYARNSSIARGSSVRQDFRLSLMIPQRIFKMIPLVSNCCGLLIRQVFLHPKPQTLEGFLPYFVAPLPGGSEREDGLLSIEDLSSTLNPNPNPLKGIPPVCTCAILGIFIWLRGRGFLIPRTLHEFSIPEHHKSQGVRYLGF